jgi:hypothetical protein
MYKIILLHSQQSFTAISSLKIPLSCGSSAVRRLKPAIANGKLEPGLDGKFALNGSHNRAV